MSNGYNAINDIGESTAAEARERIISAQLADANKLLAAWKFDASFEISNKDASVIMSVVRDDGSGFSKVLTFLELEHYATDQDTLLSMLADTIYVQMYKNKFKAELEDALAKITHNVVRLSSRGTTL